MGFEGSVNDLRAHLETLTSEGEVSALLEGETRGTAIDAIEGKLTELRGEPVAVPDSDPGTVYTRDELMAAASTFDSSAAGVAGAMAHAGLTDGATRAELEAALEDYNGREV